MSDIGEIIREIRALHRKRCFVMEQRKRMNLATLAFLRVQFGWTKNEEIMSIAERNVIAARAGNLLEVADAIVTANRKLDEKHKTQCERVIKANQQIVEKNAKAKKPKALLSLPERGEREILEIESDADFMDWSEFLFANIAARSNFDQIETEATSRMEALAEQLPVWGAWGESVRGFGARSLAVIIGEAGDLSNYPGNYPTDSKLPWVQENPGLAGKSRPIEQGFGCLWKRMGLAVMDGVRQGNLPKTAHRDDWEAHGYNPKRRSHMYIIGDCLVKNGTIYRQIYLTRKEYERQSATEAGMIIVPAAKIPKNDKDAYVSDGHIHKRAQRYMEKKLLRDLWKAWRRATQSMPERAEADLPSALSIAA